ncbi:hypothetical protein J8273_5444 [Carpediemonas membranifera]|uniref:Uncharacterized protein n=1 Tax=Carpediemonas membranifera TaxID=201153 RepID=A0A8J6E2Y0_9EUKA|nr:hypothetical protein J8273_5444 [Carpediemonas membranifera]|eukprot:KAG9392452.1 hypothetical protein J8273_5444 [Carpediemonas membranifera]
MLDTSISFADYVLATILRMFSDLGDKMLPQFKEIALLVSDGVQAGISTDRMVQLMDVRGAIRFSFDGQPGRGVASFLSHVLTLLGEDGLTTETVYNTFASLEMLLESGVFHRRSPLGRLVTLKIAALDATPFHILVHKVEMWNDMASAVVAGDLSPLSVEVEADAQPLPLTTSVCSAETLQKLNALISEGDFVAAADHLSDLFNVSIAADPHSIGVGLVTLCCHSDHPSAFIQSLAVQLERDNQPELAALASVVRLCGVGVDSSHESRRTVSDSNTVVTAGQAGFQTIHEAGRVVLCALTGPTVWDDDMASVAESQLHDALLPAFWYNVGSYLISCGQISAGSTLIRHSGGKVPPVPPSLLALCHPTWTMTTKPSDQPGVNHALWIMVGRGFFDLLAQPIGQERGVAAPKNQFAALAARIEASVPTVLHRTGLARYAEPDCVRAIAQVFRALSPAPADLIAAITVAKVTPGATHDGAVRTVGGAHPYLLLGLMVSFLTVQWAIDITRIHNALHILLPIADRPERSMPQMVAVLLMKRITLAGSAAYPREMGDLSAYLEIDKRVQEARRSEAFAGLRQSPAPYDLATVAGVEATTQLS